MFRKTTLKNGVRVVTEKLAGTKAVTMLVFVGAGSRYEEQKNRGIAHFLEHMFFKGGDRFVDTKAVSEAIDSVGGEFNAFTGKEYAGYYVKVAVSNVKVAADVLSDMLLNAKFPDEEIDKERGVILEEYNMYQDTPMYQIGWDFERLIFGDQQMGWDQIGLKDVITSVKHEDFADYKGRLYTSDNIVVSVCGNIEHDDAVELVNEYFDMENGKMDGDFHDFKKVDGGDRVMLREKKTEQAHVAIGFPGYAIGHKDHYALRLLAVALGGNMSSRMFLGVREAKGLAYYVRTTTENYTDAGAIVTNAGVDLKRTDEAIEGIIGEYKRVLDDGVGAAELAKAKAFLKGKIVLSLEDSEEFAHMLAKYELMMGGAVSPDEIFKKIDAVSVADVARVAEDVLRPERMKMALIGPYSDVAKFEGMLKF